MSIAGNILVDPCWEWHGYYGEHEPDCSIGKNMVKHSCDRDGHVWEPSGMTLVRRNRLRVVEERHDCPDVEMCKHCGLLRLPVKEQP